MLHVFKSKCYKVISETIGGDNVLLDVVRDLGDTADDIRRFFRDDEAGLIDLLSWVCPTDDLFIKLIDFVINPPAVSGEKQASVVSALKEILLDCGYDLIEMSRLNGKPRYKMIEFGSEISLSESADVTSFDALFPLGLPVSSNIKPNFTINSVKGRQKPGFVENKDVGILRGDVYPRFDIIDFMEWCDPEQRLGAYTSPDFNFDNVHSVDWTIGYNLCTTPTEKQFFEDYLSTFVTPFKLPTSDSNVTFDHLADVVPALIPQVWVRFESYSSNERNRMGYKDERMPYRVDFVAFWNSRRYIIMIDGIEHYAKQGRGGWDADEETYAARLREDRLLRTEGWHVFRVGNWEVKDDARRKKVLQELREFIGFDMPTPPVTIIRPRVKVGAPVRAPIPPPKQVPYQPPIAAPRPIARPAPRRVAPLPPPIPDAFYAGQKVYHPTFENGIIVSVKQIDDDVEITVAFAGKGVKRLKQSLAKLTLAPPKNVIDDDEEDVPF